MFSASSLMRLTTSLAACALALVLTTAARCQTIDLSLNVLYDDPGDNTSGGTWELVAKTSAGNFGVFTLSVNLLNINFNFDSLAPTGNVNGTGPAGFSIIDLFEVAGEDYFNLFAAQEPRPSGQQGAFYGVGRLANGSPIYPGQPAGTNSVPGSPNLTTLTNVQSVPWATGDTFNNAAWDIAAAFASGTFAPGVTPSFAPGHTGRVFSTVGTISAFGQDVEATTITTIVRTNLMQTVTADYNNDGVVDAADYVAWRKDPSAFGGDPAGYDAWVEQFGNTAGPGAGGQSGVSLSNGGSSAAVPEPASLILLVFGLASVLFARRRP
jgi:hypothetical protein